MRLGWESLREKHVFERNRRGQFNTKIPLQQNLISDATFTKPSLQRPNRTILWVCMCDMVLRETKLVTLKNKCFRYYFRWNYWPHIDIKEFGKNYLFDNVSTIWAIHHIQHFDLFWNTGVMTSFFFFFFSKILISFTCFFSESFFVFLMIFICHFYI